MDAEKNRKKEDKIRKKYWKRWGSYLPERQWGTVREDYSADGSCWDYFPHDHARSRAYRWGEDGIFGLTDRQCRLCLGIVLWNTKDPILKERFFGLPGPQGNHGEDVKELYYYLDNTPTHSYMKGLYKYPQAAYPYCPLEDENDRRTKQDLEYELLDTGLFDENKYWDVTVEYCKASPNDILCRYTITNRGPESATIHVLPQLWFRNTWSFGCANENRTKPTIVKSSPSSVTCTRATLGIFKYFFDAGPDGVVPELLFTDNETNYKKLFDIGNSSEYVRDAFHDYILEGDKAAVNPACCGTKMAAHHILHVASKQEVVLRMRLCEDENAPSAPFEDFDSIFQQRIFEADCFYEDVIPNHNMEHRLIARQAYAGLLWSKQFYHYVVKDWLEGDLKTPEPPCERLKGRNSDWTHLYNRDIISVPDKWEYPWYASWDLAFHMVPFAQIDIEFAKAQLLLFLREWYMHPNGQIPAYEFNFNDVNPPVHAYAALKVYKASGATRKERDAMFLARCFQKLLINFTWWVNRKDPDGHNLFTGGFLGFDNIGVFDRSKPLPYGAELEQADSTAWMAFFCLIMLEISLILADHEPMYQDMASKFFEHFISITDAINRCGEGKGLWDEEDGFYYDHIRQGDNVNMVKVRSMVGFVPLFSCLVLHDTGKYPEFMARAQWFLDHRKDLAERISFLTLGDNRDDSWLLSTLKREQLIRVLKRMLDEKEFLSPYGIRSLSKSHEEPYVFSEFDKSYSVDYVPGESTSVMFGGNSNWRGPIWMCMNFLIVENLQRYDYFYGDTLKVECPTGSGHYMRLKDVARELSIRQCNLFVPDFDGRRPCHGDEEKYANDEHFRDLILFYEYFHGDTGRGCGASHQTGWTALVVNFLKNLQHLGFQSDSTSSLSSRI